MNEPADRGGQVFCHSGDSYAQRPLRFIFEGQEFRVARILAEARHLNGKKFSVLTECSQVFVLFYHEGQDVWRVTPTTANLPAK